MSVPSGNAWKPYGARHCIPQSGGAELLDAALAVATPDLTETNGASDRRRRDEKHGAFAMKTNTPSADALMSRIRNQFPRESEEQHRKRFIEIVRNGDWKLREEIVKSLFAVYLNRAYR